MLERIGLPAVQAELVANPDAPALIAVKGAGCRADGAGRKGPFELAVFEQPDAVLDGSGPEAARVERWQKLRAKKV
jgi:hypothetical protein